MHGETVTRPTTMHTVAYAGNCRKSTKNVVSKSRCNNSNNAGKNYKVKEKKNIVYNIRHTNTGCRHTGCPDNSNINSYNLNAKLD